MRFGKQREQVVGTKSFHVVPKTGQVQARGETFIFGARDPKSDYKICIQGSPVEPVCTDHAA